MPIGEVEVGVRPTRGKGIPHVALLTKFSKYHDIELTVQKTWKTFTFGTSYFLYIS